MSLVKKSSGVLVSNSATGAAGKAMIAGSAIGGGLWLLAGVLPFISFPVLLVILFVAGILIAE